MTIWIYICDYKQYSGMNQEHIKTAIVSLKIINQLLLAIQTNFVLCGVRTESLYIMQLYVTSQMFDFSR
jgi:hypothetical protein